MQDYEPIRRGIKPRHTPPPEGAIVNRPLPEDSSPRERVKHTEQVARELNP